MYRLAVWCGVGCFVALAGTLLLFKSVMPEGVIRLSWVVLVTGLAAWCAWREPKLGWQAGATIILVQWLGDIPLELVLAQFSSRALVTLFVTGLGMAIVSPVPMLAAELAARVRRRHDSRAHASNGVAS